MLETKATTVSIIVPTLNEAQGIEQLLGFLQATVDAEILVVDGGSTDGTPERAAACGVTVVASPKGRAIQMNMGARAAHSDVLYFLHADTFPPKTVISDIQAAVANGAEAGSFTIRFDHPHPLLRITATLVNNVKHIRLGDQSLFVTRVAFERVSGFDETCIVMEDADIVKRLRKQVNFSLQPTIVTTSARKFLENGVVRLCIIFYVIYIMYMLGFSQQTLLTTYKRLIRQDKI